MFFTIHQDFEHHVPARPVYVLRPWLVYDAQGAEAFPPNIPSVQHTKAQVDSVCAQVSREYGDSPPQVTPRPIPDPPTTHALNHATSETLCGQPGDTTDDPDAVTCPDCAIHKEDPTP